MWNAGVSQLRLTSTSSELQCVLKLCAVQYGNGLVLFADLDASAKFQPCLWPFLHFPLPLIYSQLRSTVTIESLHSNHLTLARTVILSRSLAHVSPTPACPNAPVSSTQHAYSSPRSRPPGTPHQESHTPEHVSFKVPSTLAPSTTHLVEVEHQIQLAHVPKERIQHLDEEVYRLQVRQFVVVCIDARAEEQPCVPSIHDLGHIAELDEVGLVLLVARRDQAVDLGVSDGHVRSGRGRGGDNGVERDRWRV